MSLDISLYENLSVECDCGKYHEIKGQLLRSYNITHNLNKMAEEAGLYKVLRRPEELGISTGKQALPLLKGGLQQLLKNPSKSKKFNPENGRGSYEGLVKAVQEYIGEVEESPDCFIEVSR